MFPPGTKTGTSGRRGGSGGRAGRAVGPWGRGAGGVAGGVAGADTGGEQRLTPGHSRPAGTTLGRCESTRVTPAHPHSLYVDAPLRQPGGGLCTSRHTQGGPPANLTISRERRVASPRLGPLQHTLVTASSHSRRALMVVTTPTGVRCLHRMMS